MTERYTHSYRILGVRPGASWKQLRKAYKSLVNTWHPDRFQQDVRKRKLAEEKTKEITQSYKELAEYYKKFGVLPLADEPETHEAEDAPPPIVPERQPEPESRTKPTPAGTAPVDAIKRRRTRAMAAIALVGGAYIAWQLVPWNHPGDPSSTEERTSPTADTQEEERTEHRADKNFTIGSSLGEVYGIQGVPTKTEKDIWFYGESKVYFVKGKVLRWEESSDNPLKVRITLNTETSETRYFEKGASKDEVLAAQGAPDRDAGSVWDYGVSRVYFDKDRVTGWHEAPLNPLRVRH